MFIRLGGISVTSAWLTWHAGVLNSTPRAVLLPEPLTTPLKTWQIFVLVVPLLFSVRPRIVATSP